MERFENIWSFETANLRVEFDVAPEDDLDLSWDEDGSTRAGLDSGEYVAFIARVRALHKATGAELATDYLGGCIYKNPSDFMDHRLCGAENRALAATGETARGSSYFSSMVSVVCADARKTLAGLQAIRVRGASK